MTYFPSAPPHHLWTSPDSSCNEPYLQCMSFRRRRRRHPCSNEAWRGYKRAVTASDSRIVRVRVLGQSSTCMYVCMYTLYPSRRVVRMACGDGLQTRQLGIMHMRACIYVAVLVVPTSSFGSMSLFEREFRHPRSFGLREYPCDREYAGCVCCVRVLEVGS